MTGKSFFRIPPFFVLMLIGCFPQKGCSRVSALMMTNHNEKGGNDKSFLEVLKQKKGTKQSNITGARSFPFPNQVETTVRAIYFKNVKGRLWKRQSCTEMRIQPKPEHLYLGLGTFPNEESLSCHNMQNQQINAFNLPITQACAK